jgi:hypothetical protein
MSTTLITIECNPELKHLLQGLSIDHYAAAVRSLITRDYEYQPKDLDQFTVRVIDHHGHQESATLSDK